MISIDQYNKNIKSSSEYLGVISHSYLEKFSSGKLSKKHVENVWCTQQACLSRSFSHCMGALFARLPPKFVKENGKLVEIIAVEAWGGKSDDAHPQLFEQMRVELDVIPNGSRSACLETTDYFVNERQKYLLSSNIFECLGMLITNEYLNADNVGKNGIMVCYRDGLLKLGYGEKCAEYAQAHVEEEVEDVILMLNVLNKLLGDDAELQNRSISRSEAISSFYVGSKEICRLRKVFFDGLENSLNH